VTRDTTFKVKGEGHQAALLTAVLTHQAAAAVSVGTYWPWEPTATLPSAGAVGSAARSASAPTEGGEGRGILWQPPAYRLFDLPVNFLHVICDLVKNLVIIHNCSILGRVAQTKTIVSYFIIHWCLTATSAQTGFIVAYEYEM